MALHLTYLELAQRIGRSEPAARSLAKRKRWRRTIGNDGIARIAIDEAEVVEIADPDRLGVGRPPANSTRAVKAAEGVPPACIPDDGLNPVQTILADLKARLAAAEALAADRQTAVDAERGRADRLVGEIADLAREVARIANEAGSRERDLRDRAVSAEATLAALREEVSTIQSRAVADVDQARGEAAAWQTRPWWRRLAG